MAVNLENGAQKWWSIDFNTAPSRCRWDSWTAPSGGQIPGEGSRTRPECCFQLRPTPSSNWCHCNRDNIQPREYRRARQRWPKRPRRRVSAPSPTQISKDLPASTVRTVRVTAECTSFGQHTLKACIQDCSCVSWNSDTWHLLSKLKSRKHLNLHCFLQDEEIPVAAAGVSKMVSEFSASTVSHVINMCLLIGTSSFSRKWCDPRLYHQVQIFNFKLLIITKTLKWLHQMKLTVLLKLKQGTWE